MRPLARTASKGLLARVLLCQQTNGGGTTMRLRPSSPNGTGAFYLSNDFQIVGQPGSREEVIRMDDDDNNDNSYNRLILPIIQYERTHSYANDRDHFTFCFANP